MIYSLYIFDRHCDCIYYQDWHRTSPVRLPAPTNFKQGIHRLGSAPAGHATGHATGNTNGDTGGPSISTSSSVRESIFSNGPSVRSSVQSTAADVNVNGPNGVVRRVAAGAAGAGAGAGLPFDEEAKLVYGVVLSLRNMVKKLSGREEAFTSYRTPSYKFHLFETPSNIRFVLLSDPSSDSLRFVLRQIYTGPFVEHVVRNPLIDMEDRETGVDNEQFRAAVDRHIRALSMFGT